MVTFENPLWSVTMHSNRILTLDTQLDARCVHPLRGLGCLPRGVCLRECLPGGCLPSGCFPGGVLPRGLPRSGVCPGLVSARGYLPSGVSAQCGICLGGCLPRGSAWGCLPGGVCLGVYTSPCEYNSYHTLETTLPFHNFVCGW